MAAEMLAGLMNDLVVQTAVLPLVAGLLAPGILRLVGGAEVGGRWAAAGPGLAFLAIFLLIIGWPGFPPNAAVGKLGWGVMAGLVVALLLDLRPRTHGVRQLAGLGLLLLVGAWILSPLVKTLALGDALRLAVLGIVVALIWPRLAPAADASRRESGRVGSDGSDDSPVLPATLVLMAALAVGGVALVGASASLAQLGFALAASIGGLLLWNWPQSRHHYGVAALWAGGGTLLLLIIILVFFTQSRAEALLAAVPLFFVDRLSRACPLPANAFGRALAPVVTGVLALVPALAAIGLAYLLSGALTGGAESPSGY